MKNVLNIDHDIKFLKEFLEKPDDKLSKSVASIHKYYYSLEEDSEKVKEVKLLLLKINAKLIKQEVERLNELNRTKQ